MEWLRMSFSKFSRQRLFTLFFFGILFLVAYFVLEAGVKSFSFRQPLSKNNNRKSNRGSNKMRRKSFLNQDVQFCYYDSSLVISNTLNDDSYPMFSKCMEQRKELFYLTKGTLHVNRTILTEEKLSLQRCVVKSVEWRSDDSHAVGDEVILGNIQENQSSLAVKIKSDFIHIHCDVGSQVRDQLSRNFNMLGVPETEDNTPWSESNSNDPASMQNDIFQKYEPSLVGSLGLPDFLYGVQSERKTREPSKQTGIGRAVKRPQETKIAKQTYSQYLVHVAEQKQTVEKLAPLLKYKPAHAVNVLILVLESVSQLSFDKNFKEVKQTFKDPIILHGFNVLGDSAIATLLPLLTGMKDEDVEDLKRKGNGGQFVSALPFIWNQFEGRGYATLFAEDQPRFGTFQNHFMGFEEPPVDHYMRPFWLATEMEGLGLKDKYCIGSKLKHKYILEYMRSFFDRYKDIPKFALGFISEYEGAQRLDIDLRDFFESLKAIGASSNTLTILLGDHGTNHGKRRESFGGMLNERLPLALISMPDVLISIRPEIMGKLKENRNKLTTAFDIHATLLSLVNSSPQIGGAKQTRGLSLFQEIPLERTCQSADLTMHYCTCSKYETITDLQDPRVGQAAIKIIGEINKIIQEDDGFKRCKKMFLKKIISARFVMPNDMVHFINPNLKRKWLVTNFMKKLSSGEFFLQVTLQATPGNAVFEGTVSFRKSELTEMSDSSINLEGISRINEYKEHAKCTERTVPSLARFCICSAGMGANV